MTLIGKLVLLLVLFFSFSSCDKTDIANDMKTNNSFSEGSSDRYTEDQDKSETSEVPGEATDFKITMDVSDGVKITIA